MAIDPKSETKPIRLCGLEDVPENGSNGFLIETERGRFGVMVIRREAADFFVYVNSCPHIGTPLDIVQGKFLNREGTHILCTTHGALFRIEDGHCVSGPCAGDNLMALTSELRQGNIFVTLPAAPTQA